MLFILIDWLYVFLTTFCLGYAFSEMSGRLFSYRLKHIDSILVAGLVCATVYAQIFSLFYRVSALANGVLLVFCLAVILVFRRRMRLDLKQAWNRSGTLFKVLIPVLLLVWAFCTSRGYQMPDAMGYHAQSIRWIEEYGIVPGQAVLNSRFSYNSSVFALSALYSLKFLVGQSLHAMSGWIAFLLSVTVLDVIKGRRRLRWSDYANVAAIYYLTTLWNEVISSSSDYASMCIIFFLIIKWVRLLEMPKEEQKTAPYALLCVLGVFALTLKVTAGLILLLLIKPAYQLLREKQWKEILLYLTLGLVVAVPWMTRSVLLSGWLIYPLPQLDLFDVAWKQKVEWIDFDVACIKTWGRGLHSGLLDMPVWEWFGGWFRSVLTSLQKVIVLADIAAVFLFALFALLTLIRKKWENLDKLLVLFTVVCSYLYWQLSAPLPRYGYAYILLVPALMCGVVVLTLRRDGIVRAVLALGGLYKIWMLVLYMHSSYMCYSLYIRQPDYESPKGPVYTKEVDGVTFYYSQWEGLGYEYFPGGIPEYAEFRLRGDGLEDGFEWVNPE